MSIKGNIMKIDGLPVIDGEESVTLVVSTDDVKSGRSKKPGKCAAAIACKRMLHAKEARVHIGRVYLRFGKHWKRYLTSPSLRSEIVAFDRGGRFAAGEYTLLKMQPSRATDMRPNKPTGAKSTNKKRQPYHILHDVRPMPSKKTYDATA